MPIAWLTMTSATGVAASRSCNSRTASSSSGVGAGDDSPAGPAAASSGVEEGSRGSPLPGVHSPLTLDYAAAQRLVQPVAAGRPLRDGTAIGTGLATGLNLLRESTARGKVAILLTDGQNNAGDVQPTDAAQIAKLLGVRLYTIGAVAARSRAEVDEALMKRMSETTGGLYFRASDETALRDVYREIETLEKARVGTRAFISTEDASLPFAAAGAGLIALQFVLALTVFRRTP